jgi:hypothetical protein
MADDPGKKTLKLLDPGHVTQPLHPETIPAPPVSLPSAADTFDDDEPPTDPGAVRWVKVVKKAVRDEITQHETQARGRYATIQEWWIGHGKRITHLERHGIPRAATLLLVLINIFLACHVYLEWARSRDLRASPVIRVENAPR